MSDIFDHPDLQDPAWDKKLKRETRRTFWRRNRMRLSLLVVLVVVIGAAVAYNALGDKKPAATPQQAAQTTTTVPTTPSMMRTGVRVDLTQPFAATPAAGWSDGEAGVVVPPATDVNGFSAAKVAEAMTKARAAFVEANLDRAVIQDGNVEPLATLFAKDGQAAIRSDPAYRIRIAPGHKLLPAPTKVNGEVTVEPGKKGEIIVRFVFSLAYAFEIPDPGDIQDVMDIVSVQRIDARYAYRDGSSYAAGSRGLWPATWTGYYYFMNCAKAKEGLLAPAYSERRLSTTPGDRRHRAEAFDPKAPMPTNTSC